MEVRCLVSSLRRGVIGGNMDKRERKNQGKRVGDAKAAQLVWHSADAPQIWRSWSPPPGGDDDVGGTERRRGIDLSLVVKNALFACCLPRTAASTDGQMGFHSRADAADARARRDGQRGRASPPSPPRRWPGLGLAGMLRLRRSTVADGGQGSGGLRAAERKVLTEMEAGEELLQRHERGGQGKCERERTNGLCRDCWTASRQR